MVKCLIIDDEPLAQQVIEKYISETEGLQLAGKCFNASEAFGFLHTHQVDLVFIDIRMPSITGIDFIRSLSDPPAFIFTTAYAEHAVAGFELQAVDYLLKPITLQRFQKSIARYLKQQPPPPAAEEKNYLYIKVDGSLVKLQHHEILFAQSMKDYIRIVTPDAQYLTHLTMKSLGELLPAEKFRRVHRSYLINAAHVDVIGRESLCIGKHIIPIGGNYKTVIDDIRP